MLKTIVSIILAACILSCATFKFSDKNVNLVMAKNVEKNKGASDIVNTFTFEGIIYVYATFTQDDVYQKAGNHKIETKWYHGDKLVSIDEQQIEFGRPPHYVWFSNRGTTLGAGPAKVEIYADGDFLTSTRFEVIPKQ